MSIVVSVSRLELPPHILLIPEGPITVNCGSKCHLKKQHLVLLLLVTYKLANFLSPRLDFALSVLTMRLQNWPYSEEVAIPEADCQRNQ